MIRGKYSSTKGQQSAAKGSAFSVNWRINGIYFKWHYSSYVLATSEKFDATKY